MEKFSEWLNHYMENRGLTGDSFHVSSSTMSAYRNSRTLPKWPDYVKICRCVGLMATRGQYQKFKAKFERNEKR